MSRSLPSLAQASLMASSSACAVGSRSCKRAVAGACQHLARGAHHHGADGHLARKAGGLGLGKGEIHGPLAWGRHICKLFLHGRESGREAKAWSRGQARDRKGGGAHAHRQGHGPCRALLAARRRKVDRARPGRGQRHGADHAGLCGQAWRQGHRRRQAAAAGRGAAAVALSQAEGARDQPQGPARAEDRVRGIAARASARGLGGAARSQHRRASAAHHRRRACEASGAAEHRLAAPLSRAGARQGHAKPTSTSSPRA